jgi:hypothetical protein
MWTVTSVLSVHPEAGDLRRSPRLDTPALAQAKLPDGMLIMSVGALADEATGRFMVSTRSRALALWATCAAAARGGPLPLQAAAVATSKSASARVPVAIGL